LLHLIDGTREDVVEAYETIRNEVSEYSEKLQGKQEIVALNKCDALTPEEIKEKVKALKKASGKPVHAISAAAGMGVEELLRAMWKVITEVRAEQPQREAE